MQVNLILLFSIFFIGSVSAAAGANSGGGNSGGAKLICVQISAQVNGTLTPTASGNICTPLPAGSTTVPNCVASPGVSKCGVPKPRGA